MEDIQVRAVAPTPIPNANGMTLIEDVPMLSLKFQETIWDSKREARVSVKTVTRNFDWLSVTADAKDIYTFAEKVELYTDNDGLMDVIVVNKTSVNL